MQPAPHRRDGSHRVRVIRRADHHRVERFLFVEHFAEIAVPRGIGKFLEGFAGPLVVDVGDRDDPFGLHSLQIVPAATPGADDANRQLVFGRRLLRRRFRHERTAQRHARRQCRRLL